MCLGWLPSQGALSGRGAYVHQGQGFLCKHAFRPDGKQAGTLIPPAFGLAGVNLPPEPPTGAAHRIEVTANRAEDKDNRDAIRAHLAHIAKMFSEGDFEAPMLIHGRTPPGVPVMKRKKTGVQWKYEELENGARVVATTKDPEALSAIHEFLRFQIADHRTGDPGTVKGM